MTSYAVAAHREDGWWIVEIPVLDIVTQARRVDQIERMARDLIAPGWMSMRRKSLPPRRNPCGGTAPRSAPACLRRGGGPGPAVPLARGQGADSRHIGG